jgi:hypothetical protein
MTEDSRAGFNPVSVIPASLPQGSAKMGLQRVASAISVGDDTGIPLFSAK